MIFKDYMAYNEEKGKSHKDSWQLGRFYFNCVLWAPYYQGGCIEWVGEVQIDEIQFLAYLPSNLWTYPASRPGSRDVSRTGVLYFPDFWFCSGLVLSSREDCRTCLAPGPDMSDQPFPSEAKSFYRTCPGHSLGSRGAHQTYPVPRSDMSELSALT
jgi:hypothetical protein